jgi:hypothetical protein
MSLLPSGVVSGPNVPYYALAGNTVSNPLTSNLDCNGDRIINAISIGPPSGSSLTLDGNTLFNGDIDAQGYVINNVQNINTGLINGFPSFPQVNVLTVTPTNPIDLSLYSSASYFVFTSTYDTSGVVFQYTGKAPPAPLDASFWNLQNNAGKNITLQYYDGISTTTIGTIGGVPASVTIGVLVYQGGTYTFY